MTLQTSFCKSIFELALQYQAEVSWRKITFSSTTTATQFEVEHQKKAFLQKLTEIVRKCCQTNNTPQMFSVNVETGKAVEESTKITSTIVR